MMRVINLIAVAAALASAQSDAFVAGLEAYRGGDYAAAEREFTRAASAGTEPNARALLALTLAATSRCKQAEPELEQALVTASGDVMKLASLALAQCRIADFRFDEAAAVIAKIRTKYPNDPDVLYLAARLEMRQWNDTIYHLYRQAPGSFRVNQISGEILETQGRFAEAAAEYRKAIAKNSKATALHYRLGRALLMTSHDPEALGLALKEFQAELTLNPHDAVAEYQAAQILETQGDPAQAAAAFERAIALDANFAEPLVALGKIRVQQKRESEAISLLVRAVALAPSNETARYNLMMAYRNAGRREDAMREKAELDKMQKTPEGEFTDFLKKLGNQPVQK
jgi:tetratricopeptide (TPR) repeat protein